MARIQTGEVRAAAASVEQVARAVRNQVPDEVGGIAAAMEESASGAAGTALATAWADAYAGWVTQAEEHALALRSAAAAWEAVDADAASGFAGRRGGIEAV